MLVKLEITFDYYLFKKYKNKYFDRYYYIYTFLWLSNFHFADSHWYGLYNTLKEDSKKLLYMGCTSFIQQNNFKNWEWAWFISNLFEFFFKLWWY